MRILLTGASGGIGAALAQAFAREGHAILLQGRREAGLAELKRSLGDDADCETVIADLTNAADRERLCQRARAFAVDTLCTNAGINQFGAFPDSDVSAIIDTNVTATLLLTQTLLPLLLDGARPRIIIIGSAFGAIGFPGYAAYSASKFALRGFSEALGREYADTALSVHYLSPRATETSMNDSRVTALNVELGTQTDTPELVASQVLRALRSDRRRLQLGAAETLQTRFNALFPGLVDRALRAKLPVIKKYFKEIDHDEADSVYTDDPARGDVCPGGSA